MNRDETPRTGDEESTARPEFPEPPDPARVSGLRERMRRDQARRHQSTRGRTSRLSDRLGERTGRQARDIGTYTLIPMMMIAGPAVGYFLGRLIEKQWGGEPTVGVVGILLGLAAAFRQIFLMLTKLNKPKPDDDS